MRDIVCWICVGVDCDGCCEGMRGLASFCSLFGSEWEGRGGEGRRGREQGGEWSVEEKSAEKKQKRRKNRRRRKGQREYEKGREK